MESILQVLSPLLKPAKLVYKFNRCKWYCRWIV